MFRFALKYPNTNQIIFRNTLSSAISGVWLITIPEVINNFFPALPLMDGFQINKSRYEITFPNGSIISLKGLDNTDRVQKLLSIELQQVFFDEAHLIDYEHFGIIMSRMPQKLNVPYKVKVILCANWCAKSHWLKKFFLDKINPETNTPHGLSAGLMSSVTADNKTIDAEEYRNTLMVGADRRTRLACAGDFFYDEMEGALWIQDDIQRSELPEDFDDIVLAFDPAVTNNKNSDEHGVCIAGKINEKIYIINCFEKQEDVNVIAREVCELYHSYECSKLIYENNQGGDFIEALIRNHDKTVYCESVRAKKGKLLRAESAAALYKNGLVYHTKHFSKLEEQMLTYIGTGDSPNALDALVYSIKYLSENSSYVGNIIILTNKRKVRIMIRIMVFK
jgi:predicted phage terminase large subunit-like protein